MEYMKNVICFLGADAGVGTTMTAQAVSECLSESEIKTLLFTSDEVSGTAFLPPTSTGGTIDTLKTQIQNNLITADELMQIMIRKKNLDILPGTRSLLDRRHYQPDDTRKILTILSGMYDIIILDAGTGRYGDENGLTVGCLEAAEQVYIILTQQSKTIAAWDQYEEVMRELIHEEQYNIVLNKYIKSDMLYLPEQLSNMYQREVVGAIPLTDFGWQCEHDRLSLYTYKYDSRLYRQQIRHICEHILLHKGFTLVEKENERNIKKSGLGLFRKKEREAKNE